MLTMGQLAIRLVEAAGKDEDMYERDKDLANIVASNLDTLSRYAQGAEDRIVLAWQCNAEGPANSKLYCPECLSEAGLCGKDMPLTRGDLKRAGEVFPDLGTNCTVCGLDVTKQV